MYTKRFWVDTETTGFYPKKHFAFQISYLIEEDNVILQRRTLELRPDRYDDYEFSRGAEAVHGYSRDRIISLPPEAEAIAALAGDLDMYGQGRLTPAGYNVDFDIRFIKALFERNKSLGQFSKYFDYLNCDVLQFVQACRVAGIISLPRIDLGSICRYLDIDTGGAHNSMADILCTKAVFDRLAGMSFKTGHAFE
jgi:DNA polymerase III epsilon subunit-like protein